MKNLLLTTIVLAANAAQGLAAASVCSVVADRVNARKGPGPHYEVLFQAGRGYPVEAEQILGDWVRVRDWEGDRAWFSRRLLDSTRTAVIVADDVNVRASFGQTARAVEKVRRGEIYKVMAERNGWVQLGYYDTGWKLGWVRKDLIWRGCH
jgi:SH3-like domain-containing protein